MAGCEATPAEFGFRNRPLRDQPTPGSPLRWSGRQINDEPKISNYVPRCDHQLLSAASG